MIKWPISRAWWKCLLYHLFFCRLYYIIKLLHFVQMRVTLKNNFEWFFFSISNQCYEVVCNWLPDVVVLTNYLPWWILLPMLGIPCNQVCDMVILRTEWWLWCNEQACLSAGHQRAIHQGIYSGEHQEIIWTCWSAPIQPQCNQGFRDGPQYSNQHQHSFTCWWAQSSQGNEDCFCKPSWWCHTCSSLLPITPFWSLTHLPQLLSHYPCALWPPATPIQCLKEIQVSHCPKRLLKHFFKGHLQHGLSTTTQ